MQRLLENADENPVTYDLKELFDEIEPDISMVDSTDLSEVVLKELSGMISCLKT